MNLTDREQLIYYLKTHRLWLDRERSQHFLIDKTVLDKIVAAAELTSDDHVLEIGPGVGTLTQVLAAAVSNGLVLAVEKDFKLVTVLREEFKNRKNVKIVHEDALKFLHEIKDQKSNLKMTNKNYQLPTKLVTNLPYNITGKILRLLFDPQIPDSRYQILVLMLQKEVIDRLLAPPGTSERGILTILRELYGPAERVIDVPRTAFFPVPAVDSAVIKIFRDSRYQLQDTMRIVWLAKLGFAAKRRTLENSLAAGLRQPKESVRQYLQQAEISTAARAEDLSLAEWVRLTVILNDRVSV